MKIVVDTNILLVCISPRSKDNWFWRDIIAGVFELYVTTDILIEYAEIIGEHMGKTVADAALDLLLELPNVHLVQKYYYWQLVEIDPDDNKFVDCAIAAGVQYIVSNDKHIKVIEQYPYFKIQLVKFDVFKALLGK
jgi:uncharacterized protein